MTEEDNKLSSLEAENRHAYEIIEAKLAEIARLRAENAELREILEESHEPLGTGDGKYSTDHFGNPL